jgi:microcompartment protein CcmK/EutM
MILARVVATVVSTIKHPAYQGLKLYAVRRLNCHGEPVGESFLAVDRVQSGVGDTVLVLREGTGMRQLFRKEILPIRSAVIGVVDEVEWTRFRAPRT